MLKLTLLKPAAVTIMLWTSMLTAPASAQWLNYPLPGIPRLPDGKPNLTAPTPRAADGKADLSGVWSGPGPGTYDRNIARDVLGDDTRCADGGDAPLAYADIDQFVLGPSDASIAQNRVEFHRDACCAWND